MKRHLLLTLPLLLSGALCSCGEQAGPIEKKVALWSAYATENLLSDFDYLADSKYASREAKLDFALMKNENDGAVLMITPNHTVKSFNLEFGDVSDGLGHTIGGSNFTAAAMWYQGVFGSNESEALSGYYPDALVPLPAYRAAQRDYIDKNHNQGIYVNLKTPKDTFPGTYHGTAKLTVDGVVTDIPITVTVYDAEMPDEVHQQSCFLIWYQCISAGEQLNVDAELLKSYYDFTVSKRLSPDALPPSYEAGYDNFAENYYNEVVTNPAISTYRIPVQSANFSQGRVEGYLKALVNKNLDLLKKGIKGYDGKPVNFFKKCLFYINDEPHSASDFASVRSNDLVITNAKKKFKSLLDGYPEVQESFMSIKNVVTTGFNSNLAGSDEVGGVQTWCPQFSWFDTKEARALYASRQIKENTNREYGENVWWYGCYDPQSPYPNYHLDANIMLSRTLSAMQYDYNIEGELYWNMCYYMYHGGGIESGRDIWYDPITWEDAAGDGALLYPGLKFNIKSPITTLRLENILASKEEYEYYWLIDQKISEYNKTHAAINFHDAMRKHYAKIFDDMITVATPESYEESRRFFLEVVEKMNVSVEDGIRMLLK